MLYVDSTTLSENHISRLGFSIFSVALLFILLSYVSFTWGWILTRLSLDPAGRLGTTILAWIDEVLILSLILSSISFERVLKDPMKHIVKILTLLVTLSALWVGLLQASIIPRSYT
ncbi:uncharacterized protein, partial [Primulina eburnea]|uniref:uncharacterized protein n=1 Tax=Primulina eburnea TaxID=1245227 RepID=UPI003C6C631B